MRTQFNIFTTLIMIVILQQTIAQDIAELRIVNKPFRLASELLDKNIKDANGETCGMILVLTDFDALSFNSYNGMCKNVAFEPGKYKIFLSANERVLEVMRTGYKPLKIILNDVGINIKSGDVWQLEITADRKIELIPISIITTPVDANIYIDSENMGIGKIHQLTEGQHNIKLEKEGYKTISTLINVSTTNVLFNYKLEEIDPIMVRIISNPNQARIFIDDFDRGVTNRDLFLYPGMYSIRIYKNGFKEIKETIEIQENSSKNFQYNLVNSIAKLRMNVLPVDAIITLNNEIVNNNFELELPPGKYKLYVSKNGYKSISEILEISINAEVEKNITLKEIVGKLQISVQPTDSKIELRRNESLINSWTGSKFIKDIPVGKYEMFCTRENYSSIIDTLIITEDDLITKEIVLNRLGEDLLPQTLSQDNLRNSNNSTMKSSSELSENTNKTKNKYGSLSIKVVPNESKVSLFKEQEKIDEWYGNRDFNSLEVGKYSIISNSNGYEEQTVNAIVFNYKTTVLNVKLEIPWGHLLFNINPPDYGVEIFDTINNSYNDIMWDGDKLIKLLPGIYLVTIKKDGYESYQEKVGIVKNDTVIIKTDLVSNAKEPILPLQYKNKIIIEDNNDYGDSNSTGTLFVQVPNQNALLSLYKNGKLINRWTGSRQFSNLSIGKYFITSEFAENNITEEYVYVFKGKITQIKLLPQITTSNIGNGSNTLTKKKPVIFSKDSLMVLVKDKRSELEFYIDRTEVTVGEYRRFCLEVGKQMPQVPDWGWADDSPIVNISWYDALEYAKWSNKRLPTEAEWELAALNGDPMSKNEYSISSSGYNDDDHFWHIQNTKNQVNKVATKKPNDLEIFDMSGNVFEWCEDTLTDQEKTINNLKVVKGGSSSELKENCKIKLKKYIHPNFISIYVGLRCVKDFVK